MPEHIIAGMYPDGRDESVCSRVALGVAERYQCVQQLDTYRASEVDAQPVLVDRRGRVGMSSSLDCEAYEAAKVAGAGRASPGKNPAPVRAWVRDQRDPGLRRD